MKITVLVKLINPEYSEAIARDFFNGEDSDENFKFLWEDEMIWKGNWDEFKILHNQTFELNVGLPDGVLKSYSIPNTTLLRVISSNGNTGQMAFSKKLIKSIEKKETKNDVVVEIVLKSGKRFINPYEGCYILEDDFPTDLLLLTPSHYIHGG